MDEEAGIEELKKLFYSDNLTQAGKRKLINYYEEKIQELEEHLKEFYNGELYTAKQLKNIERDKKKYYVHKSKIDELIKEMKENGTQYWARRLEKMEEEK